MSSLQKNIVRDQKGKLDKIEDVMMILANVDIKLKLYQNLEKSANYCLQSCDSNNYLTNFKNYISTASYNCIQNCIKKRHKSIKMCLEVRRSLLVDFFRI